MNWEKLISQVREYASFYLRDNLSEKLSFHNIRHTREVVEAVNEIGRYSNLSRIQLAIVTVAAWFHDIGYAVRYTGHEDESKRIAEIFLDEHSSPKDFTQAVLMCIEATRYPQRPQSLEAKVVCDADLYHFSRPDYNSYEEALRQEFNTFLSKEYSDKEWRENNCKLLSEHSYHTDYGKEVIQKFKEVNMERIGCR